MKPEKKLKPKSKGDCSRLLVQTAPPFDHEYGYFGSTCESWAKRFGISKSKFWKAFGVNTCAWDEKKKMNVFYECDVERAIKECINKGWVTVADFD